MMESNEIYNYQENPFDFLAFQYSSFGVILGLISFTIGFAYLLQSYFIDLYMSILFGMGITVLLMYLYGSIAFFAYVRGGSSMGLIIRFLLFLISFGLFVYLTLYDWILGLTSLFAMSVSFLILQEKYKSRVVQHYSSKELIYSEQSQASIADFAIEKLVQEVILGPGYQERVVNELINDIHLATSLGITEIEKVKQESTYIEMQRILNLSFARLKNIAAEESLQKLQTLAQIEELHFHIQKLQAAASLTKLINESQKYELLMQIAHYKMIMARMARAWQNINKGTGNYNETGFEE